jgi:uncharacterized protein (TIGR02145 family)
MATYKMIQQYVKERYNKNIKTCWIAHVKEIVGLKPSIAPNRISLESRQHPCPDVYLEKIKEALKYFNMICLFLFAITSFAQEKGSFIDTRDGKTYKTVKIGEQTWMAENLNFMAKGSKCYSNKESNCNKYGRLYNWATAVTLPEECNRNKCTDRVETPHQGICPLGGHIPSNGEWATMETYVNSSNKCNRCEGILLKSTSELGTDVYSFSALLGGYGNLNDSFFDVGDIGLWWTSTENGSDYAYPRLMHYRMESILWNYKVKSGLFSVRCLQD